jgi:hypothetical protein
MTARTTEILSNVASPFIQNQIAPQIPCPRNIATFHDQRAFADAQQQQRIGRELHDLVWVHEIACGEVPGFAHGSFGVFDHDVLRALPAGVIIIDSECLEDTGIRQERPRAGSVEAAQLVDVLHDRPKLQAVDADSVRCAARGG